MKEQIYTIPVHDAFNKDSECPVCNMFATLEKDAVEYVMGPSYMEDDTRALTDAAGFCKRHIHMIYNQNNRLGMAWVMKTHFDKIINDTQKAVPDFSPKGLKKGIENSKLVEYLDKLNHNCYVCNRINDFFDRYVNTVFYLWKSEPEFRETIRNSKGFCNEHFVVLLKNAPAVLSGDDLSEFAKTIYDLYESNMERVRDDLEWFINKFDYRYENEPWKNAKDALPRSVTKANSDFIEPGK